MSEWLTDKEKRILLSAISREKEVCIKVDKENCREPYEQSLESVCNSLEHKFMYDRLFKKIEEQVKISSIDECFKTIQNYIIEKSDEVSSKEADLLVEITKEIYVRFEKLKEQKNE